ncbi:MAG: PPC domain-containing protein [Brevundimonas sp.]|uniref:PPC domain-containing protein n=1 Tax=Brevundimonas sp. TaxID=1871086 RepID=UPI002625A10D|nr:PPC domain-containing protein [Brevundimonas sp.]MDI6623604.1 PPC domain-containing protein [Brevundimonas sp.]MDQ7813354.1 PPC domain-containing protein [Brevundimonas sp.]
MRRQTILAAASCLALVLAAGPVLAQSAEPLAVGATVEGAIEESDQTAVEDSYRYDDYAVTARAGQRFEAILRSGEFDTYLEVFPPNEAEDALASDDDGLGEGTDSRLRFTTPEAGTYVLRARPLSGLDGGAYTLRLTERPPAPRAPRPSGIRLGQTVEGELSGRDPETDDGLPYDAFSFRARQGDRFAVALDSEAFDPVLRLGRSVGGAFVQLAENDDGPDSGLNSRLVFTAPENGDYLIRVTPLNVAETGPYSLSLQEGPPPAAAQPIAIGATVEGELTEGDGKSESDTPADAWRFEGQEGQRVRIDMTSDDFDTYLELFDENRVSLDEDDDGGPEGTNSRMTVTLPRTGSYIIEARAFSDGTGDYSLSIIEVQPDRPPEPIAFGASLQGEIGEGDPRDDEDRGYDAFTFSGVEGQRIQAIMRSGDFDTYLQIGKADGEFTALASDDDGLMEGTDSRLNFTLPEDGDYVLRALPLGSDAEGLYALELIDRGPLPQPGSVLIGSTAWGTLTETDATTDSNVPYDAYRITVREDEKLLITMVSNDVDSFVVIGREKGDGEFEILGSDDDGLTDTHARLEWTAPDDGTFEIRAGAYQHGQLGVYALTVEKQP